MTETEKMMIPLTSAEIGALLDLALLSPCEYTEHQASAVMKLAKHFREIHSRSCRTGETSHEAGGYGESAR